MAIQPFFGGEERTKSEMELAGVDVMVTTQRTDFMWNALMGDEYGEAWDRNHPMINVSGPKAADISKVDLPATMVVIAGFDSLKDWQRRYYEWLKNSGKEAYLVEYPTMIHAFYIFPELPESTLFITELKNFIAKLSSKL